MAKNTKRISINELDKAIAESQTNREDNVITESWFGIDVTITRSIGLKSMMEFVDEVVDGCFSKDGEFIPEVIDFLIKNSLITRYTNITLPSNIERKYEIIYNTTLIEFLFNHINLEQYKEIYTSIATKIDYMCDNNTAANQKKIDELISAFENLNNQMVNMFSDISSNDVAKLIGAVGSGKFDENKIVEAYINQKSKPETITHNVELNHPDVETISEFINDAMNKVTEAGV